MDDKSGSGPWWRHGHMWMVVGGPAVVVAAAFVTLYLAIRTPDPVYVDPPRANRNSAQPADEAPSNALAPAIQARNHAATGVVPVASKDNRASAPSTGSGR